MSTNSTVPDFLAEEEYDDVPQPPKEDRPFNPILDVDEDQEDELNAPPSSSVQPIDAVRTDEIDEDATHTSTSASSSKYGRRDLRERDQLAMAFLRKFSLVSSKQMGIVLGVKRLSAHKRLLGLKELGMVNYERLPGMSQLWYLTQKGHDFLNFRGHLDDRVPKPHKAGRAYFGRLGHSLAVTQVAAQLVAGVSSIPQAVGIELPSGLDLLLLLVPETFMNRAFSTAFSNPNSDLKQGDRAWAAQKSTLREVEADRLPVNEILAQHPELWTVVPPATSQKNTKTSHPSDLVIDREHLRRSLDKPVSIALEIELHLKDQKELRRIAGAFRANRAQGAVPLFGQVIYVTHDEKIVDAVDSATKYAKAASLFKTQDLLEADGSLFSGKAWEL